MPSLSAAQLYGERLPARHDAFRSVLLAGVRGLAQRRPGRPVPRSDRAVDAVAQDICRGLPANGPPPARLVEFVLRNYGLIDPPPHLVVADIPAGPRLVAAQQLVKRMEPLIEAGRYDRLGSGVCRPQATPDRDRAVVALIDTRVVVQPIPRRMRLEQRVPLDITLRGAYQQLRIVVASPDARVTSVVPTRRDERRFGATLSCAQTGVYRVELTGVGRFGDEVLANFPVYCGRAPAESVRYRAARPLPSSAEQAERQVFALTNGYRQKAGLRLLRNSEPAGHVARSHGVDMMQHGFVGHQSPRTGSPADRIRRAGIRYLVVRENIARAYSVEEALQELINSPAHRANLLSTDVTHLGVGVVIDRRQSVPVLLVTQNFIRTGEPFSAETAPDVLLTQINRQRGAAHARPLSRSGTLDRLARAFLEDVLSRGEPAAESRLSRALQQSGVYARVQGLFVRVTALEAFQGQKEPSDTSLTHVGLAVRRSGDEILIVALLAQSAR